MGQYQLWLHHREVDQNLHKQLLCSEQELAEIDEYIARIEKTAMQRDNALFTSLMQHVALQEYTSHEIADTTEMPREYNVALPESTNSQKYQSLPLANSEQQNTAVSPALSAWGQLPNFDAQDIYRLEEKIVPVDATQVLSEAADDLLPSDLNMLFEQAPEAYTQPSLPWWLRNRLQPPHENQIPQQTPPPPTNQQRVLATNPRMERLFARRTRLVPYNEQEEGQKK